jgi:adenylate cyclase
MGCISCGLELSSGFAFCPRCGQRQPEPCAGCGFLCEAAFAFCPRCGAARDTVPAEAERRGAATAAGAASAPTQILTSPLAARLETPRREADRRQATIVFADLSGFTALSERLDAEDVRAFQNVFFEALGASVRRYDGSVVKFVGDAVLAAFGAPVAHEDDPERALASALDMLTRGAALSDEWQSRLGQPVTLHIAVHTGPVVAGNLADAAGAVFDVTGDTVNTAARLLAAADDGIILVSDATCALARHRFHFEPAGELRLRGKSEPVVVHRLLGERAEPLSARGLDAHGLTAAMVGRTDELEQIISAFQRMQRGRAQVLNLVGEAGAGKTRLILEFLARLEATGRLTGIAVRRSACSSLGEPTYGIFAALFREGYQVQSGDKLDVARDKLARGLRSLGAGPEVAAAIAPVLSYMLGLEDSRAPEFEPEQLKRQIVLAARTLIEQRLHQGPLLIIVEDLHWADAASVDLLRDIADRFVDRPLMLLLSQRPDGDPPLVTHAAQTTVRLAPLSAADTFALVHGLFGRVEGSAFANIADFVASRAGGNPLFVEEIVRSLLSKGVVVRAGDAWTCSAGPEEVIKLPPTLQGLLLSRVDRLAPDPRRLLQEAAVLGVAFDEALLLAVATNPARAQSNLEALMESELIERADQGSERYRFTHALIHDVVYQNLLLSSRTELHERIGCALERAAGPHPERLSELEALGHHWSLSSDKAKGAHYSMAAGDWARALYANEDAIRHYGRALRTLAECAGSARDIQAVRERLADLLALSGRRSEALAHYETVRATAEAAADRRSAARLHRKIGGLYWEAGDRERARAFFSSGLAWLGEDGDRIERAHLFQEMGRLAFRAGDNAHAVEWAERALAEIANGAEAASHPERAGEAAATCAEAYNTLGVALARSGRLKEAVGNIERSVALAERHDLLQTACRGYTNLGVLYSSLDPSRSIETCRRGLEIAKKVGDLGFQSRLYANLAVAYCALTDRCEAEGVEAAQIAIDLDRRLGLLDHLAVPLIVLGQIHQCHGDHAPAFASYEEALGLAEQAGEPQLLFPCYDGLATLYLDIGDVSRAEAYLAKSQEVCARAGIEPDALMVLPFLC